MLEMKHMLGFKLPKTFKVLNPGNLTVEKLHSDSSSVELWKKSSKIWETYAYLDKTIISV